MNYKEMINSECKDLIRVVDSQFQLTIRLKKINEQLGKATKGKIDPTNRLTSKIQRKLLKVKKEKKMQTRLILNYSYSTPFHHVYVAQLKFSYASYCFCNRCTTLWNIKISFRRHSAVRSL